MWSKYLIIVLFLCASCGEPEKDAAAPNGALWKVSVYEESEKGSRLFKIYYLDGNTKKSPQKRYFLDCFGKDKLDAFFPYPSYEYYGFYGKLGCVLKEYRCDDNDTLIRSYNYDSGGYIMNGVHSAGDILKSKNGRLYKANPYDTLIYEGAFVKKAYMNGKEFNYEYLNGKIERIKSGGYDLKISRQGNKIYYLKDGKEKIRVYEYEGNYLKSLKYLHKGKTIHEERFFYNHSKLPLRMEEMYDNESFKKIRVYRFEYKYLPSLKN